mgnify:FL=1
MFVNLLNLNKKLIIILLIGILSLVVVWIFLLKDDDIFYVYVDDSYPFKSYPEFTEEKDENDLKVYTKIVYPDLLDNDEYKMIDKSYTDGSELDIAEESLTFEYKENVIEYNEDDVLLIEAIELLDPKKPSSQTYGIYEKKPIVVKTVLLDDKFNILDKEFSDQFFIQENSIEKPIQENTIIIQEPTIDTVQLNDNLNLLSNEDQSEFYLKDNDKPSKIILEYQGLDINESLLDLLSENSPTVLSQVEVVSTDNQIFISDFSNENQVDNNLNIMNQAQESINNIQIAYNYPIPKPDNLTIPSQRSEILEEFDLENNKDKIDYSKSYYGVQVSSVKSRLEANKFYENLFLNYGDILNKDNQSHLNLTKQEDLGSLGVWYKLRIGPFDNRSLAKKLCSSLRDEGLQGCIVVELE